jgi:peptidyl-prolyl cis-trans isomerase D
MVPVRDSATAKKLIDSVEGLIKAGQNFDSVCAKLSEDQGSKTKGGVYDKVPSGQMVEEFNDFIFGNPVGTKGIVKTIFGYHYIEILTQKGSSPAYKIAYLSNQIIPSNETDNNASNQANLFAGDSRDQKSFMDNYEKKLKPKGIQLNNYPGIKPNEYKITGLGNSRSFIKDIYKAKQGEVLQPTRVGDNYVVAVVTEVFKEGTQSIATARNGIEPILRRKKKAEQIIKKIGKVSTVEAVATTLGKPVEVADSIRMTGTQSPILSNEPTVIGAAFNSANRGKVVPDAIEGLNAVYVIRIDNVAATAVVNANVAEQQKNMYMQAKQMAAYNNTALTALTKEASIADKRNDHY